MIVIRLTRMGKKKQPTYRLVVQEKHRDPWGKAIAILGHYNPRTKEKVFEVEAIKTWIKNGAQPSPTLRNIFIDMKIMEGKKERNTTGDKPKAAEEKKA
jgi:small subunit ribosomal protein S16